MKKQPAPPVMASRFVYAAATSSPFSDKDAESIGPELEKIADANRVDDVRSLDKHLVLETLERDPDHPLWKVGRYKRDVNEAARAHWLEHTALLIRSVRVVTVNLGKREKPMPMFLYVPEQSKAVGQRPAVRSRVMVTDMMTHDPMFMAGLSAQIRIIQDAVARLDQVTAARPSPPSVVTLVRTMRSSINDYLGSLSHEAAAE